MSYPSSRFLVTGALGQLGSEFVPFLRKQLSDAPHHVIATDLRTPPAHQVAEGPFLLMDVLSHSMFKDTVAMTNPTSVLHLASLLSVTSEKYPERALSVNTEGALNLLKIAAKRLRDGKPLQAYIPSSIAVYGPTSGRVRVPESVPLEPSTIYGISKVHIENLTRYYRRKFGVDARTLRYPGILSVGAAPGGGVTDWAVDMVRAAATGEPSYTCFLQPDTVQPMAHVSDILQGTLQFLTTPAEPTFLPVYNVGALSFSPRELASELEGVIPGFRVRYEVDAERQAIAESWPESVDDSAAREDWGYDPVVTSVPQLVVVMLREFKLQLDRERRLRDAAVTNCESLEGAAAARERVAEASLREGDRSEVLQP